MVTDDEDAVSDQTTAGRSRNMAAIRRRDTKPELAVRSLLHRQGYRFRVDYPVRVAGGRPIRPDIAFTRARVAVFIDGCFWHACPEHGRRVTIKNESYWRAKLERTMARDREQARLLAMDGWEVLRYWEHQSPHEIVANVAELLPPLPCGQAQPPRRPLATITR